MAYDVPREEKEAWTVPASQEAQRCLTPYLQLDDPERFAPNPEKEVIPLLTGM